LLNPGKARGHLPSPQFAWGKQIKRLPGRRRGQASIERIDIMSRCLGQTTYAVGCALEGSPAISGMAVTTGESGLPVGLGPHLVVVDPGVEDWRALVAGLAADAELVVLDPARDGVQAIADAAHGQRGLSAIHIVAHGRPGEFRLGNAILSSASLDSHAAALARMVGPGEPEIPASQVVSGGREAQIVKLASMPAVAAAVGAVRA
jgi:Domain of unknown function (DUF4347)